MAAGRGSRRAIARVRKSGSSCPRAPERFHRRFTERGYKVCADSRKQPRHGGIDMEVNKKSAIGAASVLAAGATAAGIAVAGGGDDNEAPIRGPALDKASSAALEATGEGTVTETEAGDEESYYEVEVTLEDGTQTDVQVNRNFEVVGSETDGPEEDESGADD